MKNVIKLDPKNARKHPDRNKAAIRASLEQLGAGRSVVMDNENVLIAGNGVFEQAQELGIPVKVMQHSRYSFPSVIMAVAISSGSTLNETSSHPFGAITGLV